MIQRVISGGQTGVDRAALDAALELQIECGGWCPKGRRAEDGIIARKYPLEETPKRDYAQRTKWNVRDSDATLILCCGRPQGGTAQTIAFAEALNKPCLILDLDKPPDIQAARDWLSQSQASVLNVAGPRESQSPGIHEQAKTLLLMVLRAGTS